MGSHLFRDGEHGRAEAIPLRKTTQKGRKGAKNSCKAPPKGGDKRRSKKAAEKRGQALTKAEARHDQVVARLEKTRESMDLDFNIRAVRVLYETISAAIRPDEDVRPDEWADRHRLLPSESSAEPGRWRTDRTPYLREILHELDPANPRQEVAVAKGAQIGFSECGVGWLLYLIDVAPGPMLLVQPTIEVAQRFSKQRVAPSVDKCPRLRGKIAAKKSRDSSNSLLQKDFTGGTMIIGGANSAVGLRSMPVRYLMLDETDGYPDDCDGEGDPVTLAVRRTATFRRRKILYGSTPKYAATSRIWALYLDSDQRELHVPCPHCGGFQPITWESLAWERGKPETVHMVCRDCGCVIEEAAKDQMLARCRWVAQNPGHERAGFHISSLYSPLGWYSWATAVADYEAALLDPTKMQAFWNTVLGLPWEEEGESVGQETLERRVEDYGAADVPAGALLVTGSVDVQDRRLEVEFVGWGVGRENWAIEYHVLYGDPSVLVSSDPARPSVWQQLDELLGRTFTTGDGRTLAPSCTFVDSGGHYTTEVYRYCKARESRRVFAIKGVGGQGRPLTGKPTRSNRIRAALFPVGVDTGKELVYARLNISEPGPGYCHFPKGRGYDQAYFAGLTAEKRVIRQVQGRPRMYWIKPKSTTRNEPLDLRVYATAALEVLNVNLDRMAERAARERAIRQADTAARLAVAAAGRVEQGGQAGQAKQGTRPVRRGVLSKGIRL